jgi:hypothetical protein
MILPLGGPTGAACSRRREQAATEGYRGRRGPADEAEERPESIPPPPDGRWLDRSASG